MNDMKRAKFFHDKMINDETERFDSALRHTVIKPTDHKVGYVNFLATQNSYDSIIGVMMEEIPLHRAEHYKKVLKGKIEVNECAIHQNKVHRHLPITTKTGFPKLSQSTKSFSRGNLVVIIVKIVINL